ncbi:MAG: bifunctional hydroxymethylpyrimidine kinase/phosphomethylpyrimidine kinase [Rhodospirillales bacterium]|nr:bifunctional hydroxymethylpyrimidine kinase/phosphomethylpyrimidine kinase [Rhodospirillales bacterium]
MIIAGSDSGGGAGIQADIKTVMALGGYATTAITALTAQNTQGVVAVHDVPAAFIALQIELVLADIGADCIKIGMLSRPDVVDAVCDVLATQAQGVPVVVDPVMIAKGGHSLLDAAAVEHVRRRLLPMAYVLTPNLPEAEALAGADDLGRVELAQRLLDLGPKAVLLKGGHATGPIVVDVLVQGGRAPESFASPRIETRHTHGTGCTLASAIATGLAQGLDVAAAAARARAYVLEAIRTAPGFGSGHGPLNHAHAVRPFFAQD